MIKIVCCCHLFKMVLAHTHTHANIISASVCVCVCMCPYIVQFYRRFVRAVAQKPHNPIILCCTIYCWGQCACVRKHQPWILTITTDVNRINEQTSSIMSIFIREWSSASTLTVDLACSLASIPKIKTHWHIFGYIGVWCSTFLQTNPMCCSLIFFFLILFHLKLSTMNIINRIMCIIWKI